MFATLIKREIKLYIRKKADFLQLMLFYIIIISIFPFASSKDASLLEASGAGIVWITTLLYSTLTTRLIFEDDYKDGSFEQLLIKVPAQVIITVKWLCHFICCFIPLIAVIAVCSYLLKIQNHNALLLSLTLGIPSISLICILISSFMVGLRNASVLVTVIMMPLLVPVLIFGIGASTAVDQELVYKNLLGMVALFMIYTPLSIWASSQAIVATGAD